MDGHELQWFTWPFFSISILVTRQCFSLLMGLTAVHLLLCSFLGLIGIFKNSIEVNKGAINNSTHFGLFFTVYPFAVNPCF